ncbi:hypothetical protein AHF37_05949 [Paragonimus kellicotti]|nr:hypothetical protein AHF37_05949 [Paragonimus kellicotti]
MAQALAQGFLGNGILKGSQVTMTDRISNTPAEAHLFEPIKRLQEKFGIEYLQTNDVMAKKSDIIFACVKPNVILPALKDIKACLNDKLIISIAAGTTLDQIKQIPMFCCWNVGINRFTVKEKYIVPFSTQIGPMSPFTSSDHTDSL